MASLYWGSHAAAAHRLPTGVTPLKRDRLYRSAWTALGALALSAAGSAQTGASASELHLSTARATPSASGRSESESFSLNAVVGSAQSAVMSSANFQFRGGVAAAPRTIDSPHPVVLGVIGGLGDRAGEASETLVGFGFEKPGTSIDGVILGDAEATLVDVTGNTTITLRTPSGIGAFDNSKGAVDIELLSGSEAIEAESGYVYTPALVEAFVPRLGRSYRVRFYAEPDNFYQLALGGSIPGQALTIPGLAGSWELVEFYVFVSPFTNDKRGFATFDFTVGAMSSFVGTQVEFQSFSIPETDPLGGTFTNRLSTIVQE